MVRSPSEDQGVLIALGATLRSHREQVGLSQEALANLSGLHRTYVGALERGERNPSFLSLVKYASGLRLTVEEVIVS